MRLYALGALTFAFSVGCGGNDSGPAATSQAGGAAVPGGPSGGSSGGITAGTPGVVPPSAGGGGLGSVTPPNDEPTPPTQAPPSAQACPTDRVPFTPLRRLTRVEYANSVKALLNVDVSAAADLPVDEVTNGFSNNAAIQTVSSLHVEKYTLVSESLAKLAVQNLPALFQCDTATKGEDTCALEFARSFGRRAFRRTITAEDEQMLLAAYNAGKTGGSYAEGIEVMIRAALQSPDFLYRLETTPPANAAAKLIPLNQFEVATRLSYMIWGAGPDDALLDAAARGELGTKELVTAKVRTMLADPKARAGIVEFYNQWIGTSRLEIITKNTTLFPTYSSAVRDGMQKELPAFMEYVLWSGDHKLGTLLTSQQAFVTPALAPIYGVTLPAGGAGLQMVTLPANQGRSGILTQAGVLAVQAHPDQTSPVLRGKFVRAMLMCDPPPAPPPDVDISPPLVSEGAIARERAAGHLSASSSCNGCHLKMDPIGLAFENFDAVGQYRETENGQRIDVSGEIKASADAELNTAFVGVRELADKLAASDLVRDCVATQWFRFSSGRTEVQADTCSLATLQESFAASNGDLVELVVGMAQTDAFMYRGPSAQ